MAAARVPKRGKIEIVMLRMSWSKMGKCAESSTAPDRAGFQLGWNCLSVWLACSTEGLDHGAHINREGQKGGTVNPLPLPLLLLLLRRYRYRARVLFG